MIEIRLATDDDGENIKDFINRPGITADWSHIGGFWLIAENRDSMIGCVQLCYSRPVGVAENMVIADGIEGFERNQTVKMLMENALGILKMSGSSVCVAQVPFANKKFKRILKRRGWKTVESGNYLMKAL